MKNCEIMDSTIHYIEKMLESQILPLRVKYLIGDFGKLMEKKDSKEHDKPKTQNEGLSAGM